MDFKQLKKIMEEEGGKIIIVENGEPILIVSLLKKEQQRLSFCPSSFSDEAKIVPSLLPKDERLDTSSFVNSEVSDKKEKKMERATEEKIKVIQGTESLTKEEMPLDELTIEDLPF